MTNKRGSTVTCKKCGTTIMSTGLRGARGEALRQGWMVGDFLNRSTCPGCRMKDLRTERTAAFKARQAEADAEYARRIALRNARRDALDEAVFAQGRRKETSAMAIARGSHERAWSEVPNLRPGTH